MPEYFTDKDKEWARLQQEQRQRVREEYGVFFEEVSRILYQHDFLGLATMGCPEDEYEPETGTIIPCLHVAASPDELARIIEEEFVRWFNLTSPGSGEWFAAVAQDVWAAWRRYTAQ